MSQFTTAMDIGKRVIEAAEAMGGPMTEAQSEYLITLLLFKKGNQKLDLEGLLKRSPAHRMMFNRLEAAGLKDKIDPDAVLWLAHLADGVPGNMSLMATVVAAVVQDPTAGKPVTLEHFARHVFPFNVPNEKTSDTVWVEQKMGGGNLVDQLPHC